MSDSLWPHGLECLLSQSSGTLRRGLGSDHTLSAQERDWLAAPGWPFSPSVLNSPGFMTLTSPLCTSSSSQGPGPSQSWHRHSRISVAHQDPLSSTISWSLLKFTSVESMMLFNDLILYCPLFLLPSIFPSIKVFSNESALRITWPKCWSFSFSISHSNEYSRLISFRTDWFDILSVQGLPRWLSGKESFCQCRRLKKHGFDPWVRNIPWRRKWQPTPVFLPRKFHGQRSLEGWSTWGQIEMDMTEWLSIHTLGIMFI